MGREEDEEFQHRQVAAVVTFSLMRSTEKQKNEYNVRKAKTPPESWKRKETYPLHHSGPSSFF
jgi:hypothetical protein